MSFLIREMEKGIFLNLGSGNAGPSCGVNSRGEKRGIHFDNKAVDLVPMGWASVVHLEVAGGEVSPVVVRFLAGLGEATDPRLLFPGDPVSTIISDTALHWSFLHCRNHPAPRSPFLSAC